jgi:hypothetical protein
LLLCAGNHLKRFADGAAIEELQIGAPLYIEGKQGKKIAIARVLDDIRTARES